jgi:hypothetical protein
MHSNTAAIVIGAVGALVCVGVIVRALLVSRAKRRNLAAAYENARHPKWPPPPLPTPVQRVAAGVGASGRAIRGSVTTAPFPGGGGGGSRRYTAPSRAADPSPIYYGDPVPLDLSSAGGGTSEPSPSPSFDGDGGSFGGGGASGGWDAPSSGDSGGSSGGDSGGGSND